MAQKLGTGYVLEENKLTPAILLNIVFQISENWEKIVKKSKVSDFNDSFASGKLLNLITKYVESD